MPGVTDLPNTNGHHCYATSYKYTARCVNVHVQIALLLLVVRSSQVAPSHEGRLVFRSRRRVLKSWWDVAGAQTGKINLSKLIF